MKENRVRNGFAALAIVELRPVDITHFQTVEVTVVSSLIRGGKKRRGARKLPSGSLAAYS